MKARLALILSAALGATSLSAQDAADAFSRGDYAEAARLWQAEVEAGSPRAALRLAYLYDLGLGVPADRARAFRYYLVAATAGLPDAAFNIGVMLDSGVGFPQDVAAAAVWYGRAAARDHVRAQYNLGLLYADGNGVPRNTDLARYWLDRIAIALPAASERLADLPPADRIWAAPVPVAGARITAESGVSADLVWTSPAGPENTRFEVQILPMDAAGRPIGPMRTIETDGSALSASLETAPAGHIWRVLRIDREANRYAPSHWIQLDTEGDAPDAQALGGQVRFEIEGGDDRARAFADNLSEPILRAGIAVVVVETEAAIEESAIRYAFPQDAERAADVASFLPGVIGETEVAGEAPEVMAGEIVVRLAFGPLTASVSQEDVQTADGG